ncbi:hypothetical protein SMICM304S_07728 [Streptomyces microflavus]
MNAATTRNASWAKRGRRAAVSARPAMPAQNTTIRTTEAVFTVSTSMGFPVRWVMISQNEPKSMGRSWLKV